MAALEGQTLGKYRVLAPLGAGGMARVYRAYHPQLNRYVAIKVLRSDLVNEPEFLARFQREAQAVAALRHPNIVQVFDFDVQSDVYYMVMELLAGESLKTNLNNYRARNVAMPPAEATRVLLDTLAGLDYAHNAGIIHRDLKPANLMLTRHGQAVLTDFGIAQIVGGPKQTVSGALMGTLNYMAPEQGLQGKWDRRSDLYSMGIVLYEMLTGQVPFDADTPLAILMKHVNEPLPLPRSLNPGIPDSFERVLLKTLDKNPNDRFQTARQMSEAVHAAAHEAGLAVPEYIPPPPTTASTDSVGVFSGARRAAIPNTDFADGNTDATLSAKLTPRRTSAVNDDTPTRGVGQAVYLGVGALVIVNLLNLTVGGILGNMGRYMVVVWPVEILLVVFFLSLLMEALASIWLVLPVSLLLNVSLLLSYYMFTQQWRHWFWWPLLSLITLSEIIGVLVWAGPASRRRARQLGLLVSLLAGLTVFADIGIAVFIASR